MSALEIDNGLSIEVHYIVFIFGECHGGIKSCPVSAMCLMSILLEGWLGHPALSPTPYFILSHAAWNKISG